MVSDFLVQTQGTLPAEVIKFLFLCISVKLSLTKRANRRLSENASEIIMEIKVVNQLMSSLVCLPSSNNYVSIILRILPNLVPFSSETFVFLLQTRNLTIKMCKMLSVAFVLYWCETAFVTLTL
jgi:hypothetical protein